MSITNTTNIQHSTAAAHSYTAAAPLSGTAAGKRTSGSSFLNSREESVVDKFKQKHPDHAHHVNQQVRAGRSVREKNGLPDSVTQNMTMEEYQAYFYALLDTIPYDPTRVNDTTVISISDRGWEQMRKDPDYEAWILGYFVEDRSVRNPFFAWGNNAGNFISERFGASIEEHVGQGVSKASLEGDREEEDEEEDWWIKRHKRMKKLLKEQVERSTNRDILQKAAIREEYSRQQHISSLKQQHFLTSGTQDTQSRPVPEGMAVSVAAAAYSAAIDLFTTSIPPAL